MNIHIVDAIKKDKLILFIGAGLSVPLGFPNWNGLVTKILNELLEEDKKYQILIDGLKTEMFGTLEVLDKIKIRKKEVYQVLDREIDIPLDGLNLELHKKLGKISSKIITTNYDRVIESATKFKKVVFDNTFHIANLSEKENFLLKLHGCIENPEKCILFQNEYDDLYTNTAAVDKLKSLISDNTILFIGFSLADEYVKKQFEYINKLYSGFTKNHFILTTDNFFEEVIGVRPIKLSDWDQLDSYLDQLIDIKTNFNQTSASIELITGEMQVLKKQDILIAILIIAPIDRENIYTFEKILKNFIKYKITIDCFHFSIDTLRNLDQFDYVIVFSQTIKDKLIIEDQYMKSKLISLQEIEENLINEHLKGFFVFINKEFNPNIENITIPLAIVRGEDLSGFIFKCFQKKSIELLNNSIIINKEFFTLISFSKGNSKINMLTDKLKIKISEQIDAKKLTNFVGRKTDLEDIIRKIINTNNQILTIKGSGGIGKTSVIKKVSTEFFERGFFPDGIFFIDCEFIKNYQSFEYKIAQCFDIESSINLKDHILQNNIKIDSLIILDNFEPLLYIEDVKLIKSLLTFICEYSNLVITSREWLDLEFEERHELRALTNEEALQLFYRYYKSNINEKETKILKEDILDKLLNNNPLAIKIITRNTPKTKSMLLLKKELEADFFNITEAGYDDIFDDKVDINIERSKSLYQSISYSYKRLLANEKLLFETLSLFPDGIHMNNIKTFFQQKDYKWDLKKITDREINALENKSLIEINKGFIELQSIIGRFAEHQFLKRTNVEKIDFYKRAFNFVNYLVDKIISICVDNEALGLEIFDQNIENCLKCLDYIILYEEEKEEKLMFIGSLDYLFRSIEQVSHFYLKLRRIKNYFSDIEKADMMLETIIISSKYYEGKFEEAYIQLQKLIPIEELYLLDINDNVQEIIIMNALSVYKYRNLSDIRRYIVKTGLYNYEMISDLLFHAGEYKSYSDLTEIEKTPEFYTYEFQHNTDTLDINSLKTYINNLYKKQYTELMQTNYIIAKRGGVEKKEINKLVATNSYTSGLKSLMYGFIENDIEKARSYYEAAINNLQPIRYYYTEAIYYYAKFLQNKKIVESNDWIETGLSLARENHYRVLIHKFNCLISGVDKVYDEYIYDLPNELKINELIDRNKQVRK